MKEASGGFLSLGILVKRMVLGKSVEKPTDVKDNGQNSRRLHGEMQD